MIFRMRDSMLLLLTAIPFLGSVYADSTLETATVSPEGNIELTLNPLANRVETSINTADHGNLLIDWIRSKGGFVNSKLEIRKEEYSFYGMFSNDDIEEDEVLFSIPQECLLTSELEEPDWICTTSKNLVRELELGNSSNYAPYMNFLSAQPVGQLPSHWSDEAKKVLYKVTGEPSNRLLPPLDVASWIETDYKTECDGSDDNLDQHAFLMVVQRGWDDILVPVYDMLNHRNGDWLNTKSLGVRKEMVHVVASQFIPAGDEIYTSYDQCEDCGGQSDTYGTAEIFRDYGFVENYPQKWIFHEQDVAFELDKTEEGHFEVSFISRVPDEDSLAFFYKQVSRLQSLYKQELSEPSPGVSTAEYQAIKDLCNGFIVAITEMIATVKGFDCGLSINDCRVSDKRYDNLTSNYEEYHVTTCDRGRSLDYSDYEIIDNVKSLYQAQEWIKHPEHHNVCFDLDDIYQQCTSYRPHYHEVFVHYTARFLPEIKRVLWVGGGDGMLLHEMLKYPSLELAIGLELDQKVTRWSFKHFGSQPHWDNDKVQWWYGDAAKSLLMLPKEYFGSFDLVLVDLSETVMSMKVTKELDIMAALSLLIKPDGIFVKNELYFEKLNHLFKHTIQVNYYDVPAICSQTMVFGSNAVDFIHTNLTDHGVETLFSQLDDLDTKFDLVHDYKNNPEAKKLCKDSNEAEVPEEQEASPGILMVLEAEDVTIDLDSPVTLESILLSTLKEDGLYLLDVVKSSSSITAIFREGYVVARSLRHHNYVAFDLHLWGSFEKLEALRSSLIFAVGSEPSSASSFRIVSGGMFGADTWVDDTSSLGPRFVQECDRDQESEYDTPMDDLLVSALVCDIAGRWFLPDDSIGVVLCGPQSEQCNSIESLDDAYVENLIVLYACESISGGFDTENRAESLYECEQELIESLQTTVANADGKIGAVVVDSTASYEVLQVFNKIASRTKLKNDLFNEWGPLVVAPTVDRSDTWRRRFVDAFRGIYEFEPAFVAQIQFNDTQSSVELDLFLAGDAVFINDIQDSIGQMESKFDVSGEIRFVGGGRFNYQGDEWQPSQFFLADAYDQTNGLEQWQSQNPTGHQAVIQLVGDPSELSNELTKKITDDTLEKLGINRVSKSFRGFGEGSVIVSAWPEGNMVVVFDGREHISINVFTYDQDPKFTEEVSDSFQTMEESLRLALYDEMPRGSGRVVNWSRDIEPRETPHWALHLQEEILDQ